MTTPPVSSGSSQSVRQGGGGAPPVSAPPVLPPKRRVRRVLLKVMAGVVVVVGVGGALWGWFALNYKYATGEKSGFVQTLTKNGWLCKTWEGEMNVLPVPGAVGQSFRFTIHSDSLAAILQEATGKQVTLTYSEHVAIPSSCFGDTPFYIDGVRVAQDGGVPNGVGGSRVAP